MHEITCSTQAWVVSVRRKAHINQCMALSEFCGLRVERTIQIRGTTATDGFLRKKWDVTKAIARGLWIFATDKHPKDRILVVSGRSISFLVWLWKKFHGDDVLVIYVGDAKSPLQFHDLMIIPSHDLILRNARRRHGAKQSRIVAIEGVMSKAEPCSEIKDGKKIVVCLGGHNITYSYSGEKFIEFIDLIFGLRNEYAVVFALSARTFGPVEALVRERFGSTCRVIDAADRAGFVVERGNAGSIFVCPDSVTMISEALATGAAVYVPELDVLKSATSDFLFVKNCLEKRYVLPVLAFPRGRARQKFPSAVAIAGPQVQQAIDDWRRRRVR